MLKLKAIKLHLESPINPINQIIKRFIELFIEQHRLLLYKVDFDGADFNNAVYIESFEQMKTKVEACVRDVQSFRDIVQDSIVRFYQLQFKGITDMRIELLQNMVTSLFVQDELYVFLQCLYTLQYQKEIQALESLFAKNKKEVDLTYLEVKEDFKLNARQTAMAASVRIFNNLKSTVIAAGINSRENSNNYHYTFNEIEQDVEETKISQGQGGEMMFRSPTRLNPENEASMRELQIETILREPDLSHDVELDNL